MSTRILPPEEWHKLETPIKQLFGQDKTVPAPETAPLCVVEENDAGDIIGFLFLQLCARLEPFGSLGGASLTRLKAEMDRALEGIPGVVYYVGPNTTKGYQKAIELGFEYKGFLMQGSPAGS